MSQPSKSEARIARKNLKALLAQEKSARLVQAYIEEKPEKEVRVGANPDSIFQMKVVIECQNPDVEGSWSWGVARQWCDHEWSEKIEPRFVEWSNLTWAEIDGFGSDSGHKMHHNMGCDDICEEAQDRMIETDRFYEVLFRFRAGNLERVWGHRKVNVFHVLWYDPTHQIYPIG
ncbi:hypothetical protein [Pseudophaeobacter sp.]|uniref:hypothetical protein n=1 Tax=Pseudophaeobacter sp. TaxID=1971739 RepID=UPI0025D25B32|nr:hypothetical protein [uncultured Pseudophaeobacter sp.]